MNLKCFFIFFCINFCFFRMIICMYPFQSKESSILPGYKWEDVEIGDDVFARLPVPQREAGWFECVGDIGGPGYCEKKQEFDEYIELAKRILDEYYSQNFWAIGGRGTYPDPPILPPTTYYKPYLPPPESQGEQQKRLQREAEERARIEAEYSKARERQEAIRREKERKQREESIRRQQEELGRIRRELMVLEEGEVGRREELKHSEIEARTEFEESAKENRMAILSVKIQASENKNRVIEKKLVELQEATELRKNEIEELELKLGLRETQVKKSFLKWLGSFVGIS